MRHDTHTRTTVDLDDVHAATEAADRAERGVDHVRSTLHAALVYLHRAMLAAENPPINTDTLNRALRDIRRELTLCVSEDLEDLERNTRHACGHLTRQRDQ